MKPWLPQNVVVAFESASILSLLTLLIISYVGMYLWCCHVHFCLEHDQQLHRSTQIYSLSPRLLWISSNPSSMFFKGICRRFQHRALGVDFLPFHRKIKSNLVAVILVPRQSLWTFLSNSFFFFEICGLPIWY